MNLPVRVLFAISTSARRSWRPGLVVVLVLFFSWGTAFAQQELMSRATEQGTVRVIVGVRSSFTPEGVHTHPSSVRAQQRMIGRAQAKLLEEMEPYGITQTRRFRHIPYVSMEVDANALSALYSNSDVIHIEEDIPVPPLELSDLEHPSAASSVTDIDSPALQGSIPYIGADQAWSSGYTGSGQVSVILDTGVDKNHAFLSGKVVSEACFSSNYSTSTWSSSSVCPSGAESSTAPGSGLPCDASVSGCDHGTHVAGIAAGNDSDFSGVAKGANLIAIQVFSRFDDYCGSPCALSWRSDQISALERVLELASSYNIASVNMSLGGGAYTNKQECDADNPSIKAAIDNLRSVGIATVISSGNDHYANALNAPGCISSAVSVGSTNNSNSISSFSNEAEFLSLYAPGEAIYSSVPGGGFDNKWGTSMAAPHVAGAWAILKQRAPEAGVDRILSAFSNTGVPITSTLGTWTTPRIQVDAAVNSVLAPFMSIDTPAANAALKVPFTVAGWAIDAAAQSGTGVDAVHVWAFPNGGGSPTFLGAANLGGSRPDVGIIYGSQFASSGYSLEVSAGLSGWYTIRVFAHLVATGAFDLMREVSVTVASAPLMAVDFPSPGATVPQSFTVSGWAIDLGAQSGSGVDAIHVWAYPQGGGSPQFIGEAAPGVPRPDVAGYYGSQFATSGFHLSTTTSLSEGSYTLVVYAHSSVSGTFNNSRAVPITVAIATEPIMFVDLPGEAAALSFPFRVAGWAVDRAAPSGSGVDAIHVWAFPLGGGSPVFLGEAPRNSRPDVANAFGSQFSMSGFNLEVTGGLTPGNYTLVVFAHSSVTGTFNNSQARSITILP
jgi:subtilisin family serine protease